MEKLDRFKTGDIVVCVQTVGLNNNRHAFDRWAREDCLTIGKTYTVKRVHKECKDFGPLIKLENKYEWHQQFMFKRAE